MSRPYIELYINNQKVYFQNPPEIFITYAHTELHNPTVVKNSYTKTVTVEGTPENNRIFNEFYDMKRINNDGLFNPSRKECFCLYRNGEPMESGYVKLDKVTKRNGRITYDITLYGGLGQFLYNLQYKEDGEKMKLSDLEYNTDFNISIDRNTIKDAWQHITGMKEVDEVYDIVNFAPCYNGIPENFSADKIAIDVESFKSDDALYDSFVKSKNGYTTVDGWMIAELEKEYDEWQIGDLRSYLQRPVVRFKDVIQACCKPENNGGYLVNLDDEFFNEGNPYYENAWMTLPLLSEIEVEDEEQEIKIIQGVDDKFTVTGGSVGSKVTFTFDYGAFCNANSTVGGLSTNRYIQTWDGSSESSVNDESTNVARVVQIVAYDKNNNVVGWSDAYAFYTNGGISDDFYFKAEYGTKVNRISDIYRKQSDGSYMFGTNATVITIENLTYEDGMYFKIAEKFWYSQNGYISPNYKELYYRKEAGYDDENGNMVYNTVAVSVSSFFSGLALKETKTTVSVKRLNKQTLLNSEHTPCDYFLSYLKMFNLHIWKDMYDDVIYVKQRKNFFTNEIKDIDNYIDRSGDIIIKPLTFENKWLNFKAEYEQDEKLHKDYKNDYGLEYGIQKVDTNYNFDSSSKDILENYVFKGCITSRNKSKYYISLRCVAPNDAYDVKPFYLDGFQTYLFNGEGDTTEGTKITPKTIEIMRDWWKEKYYDFMPKPSFVDKDNKSVEGANVLLFYNGKQLLKDNEGKLLNIQISDDIPQFETLNDGEPCWIWTADWQKATDTTIGGSPYYGDGYIPMFSRYLTNDNGLITHSWDFGTPKALYIPDYSISSNSSIYEQFWKPYIRDQYDTNTRVVECKVLLRERVIGDWLQNFYYWDSRYWVLNKISDYNPTSNGSTKCEFISVNDRNNYLV